METSNKGSFLFNDIEILEYIMSFQQGPSKDKVRAVQEVCTCPIEDPRDKYLWFIEDPRGRYLYDDHTKRCSKCSDEHKALYDDDSIRNFLPQIGGCFHKMCSVIEKYLRYFESELTPAMEELKSRLEYLKSNATYRMLYHTITYKTIIERVSDVNSLYSRDDERRISLGLRGCYRVCIIRDLHKLFGISHEKYKRILSLQPL